MFKDSHPLIKTFLVVGLTTIMVLFGVLMQKGITEAGEKRGKRLSAAETRKESQLANACVAACRPSLCPPAPKKKKDDYKPMGETFCKQTGKVYFHKRVDKKLSEGAYLEVGVEYHMRSGENWAQMFTFACELMWGDSLRLSRTKYTQAILSGAEGKKASLLFNLRWRGKEKVKLYKYGVNCSCVNRPMNGLQIIESEYTPPE